MPRKATAQMLEADLPALRDTVQSAIDQGRVGKPRFVRCIGHVKDPAEVDGAIDDLLALAESWFGGPAKSRQRIGAADGLLRSDIATWPAGQSAVLAATSAATRNFPAFDTMLIGSAGTIYHEA